eukprot:m.308874 g.308874  ORF g.308874 m.308874 type:complete len:362 (+) comp44975_c0_seq1:141-1226(+)
MESKQDSQFEDGDQYAGSEDDKEAVESSHFGRLTVDESTDATHSEFTTVSLSGPATQDSPALARKPAVASPDPGKAAASLVSSLEANTGNLEVTRPRTSTRMENLRDWSVSTYKFTRQMLSEKFGRGSKTIDAELQNRIDSLRDVQRKYSDILRLARLLNARLSAVFQTQRALSDVFSELSAKSTDLHEEFKYNADTQRLLHKHGDTLLGAINFFISNLTTLCTKTIEDTFQTVKSYNVARVEYDAHRTDFEGMQANAPRTEAQKNKLENCRKEYEKQKLKFERLRADVQIKLALLDENRVKVMKKQLLLFHNATCAYFSGNQTGLEEAVSSFHVRLKSVGENQSSFLEEGQREDAKLDEQ